MSAKAIAVLLALVLVVGGGVALSQLSSLQTRAVDAEEEAAQALEEAEEADTEVQSLEEELEATPGSSGASAVLSVRQPSARPGGGAGVRYRRGGPRSASRGLNLYLRRPVVRNRRGDRHVFQ